MRSWPRRFVVLVVLGVVLAGLPVRAATAQSPPSTTTRPTRPPARDAWVVGRVVTSAGAAVRGADIRVLRTDTGVLGGFLGLFTLGLACLVPTACGRSETVDQGTTDGAGRFEGTLPGAYVAGTETDTDWVVRASLPARNDEAAGPGSSFEFETNTAVQEAPNLPLWDRRPGLRVEGYRVTVGSPAPPVGVRPATVLATTGAAVRSEPERVATFDTRLLEVPAKTKAGALRVAATGLADVRVNHSEGRTIYHQHLTTPALEVPMKLVPPSRGKRCAASFSDGKPAPSSRCSLTDGEFTRAYYKDEAPKPSVNQVTVDLGAASSVDLVVVRNCRSECSVASSMDGTTWSPLTVSYDGDDPRSELVLASPPGPTSARYVRVSRPTLLDVSEISVWPATPPATPAAPEPPPVRTDPVAADGSGDGDEPSGVAAGRGSKSDRLPSLPVAVALLALFGVGMATGSVIGSRRARRLA